VASEITPTYLEIPFYECETFFPKHSKYCILICVYNEGERLKNQLTRMKPYTDIVDIIVVDSYSTDNSTSFDLMKNLGVNSVLRTNRDGVSKALQVGLFYALKNGYDGIITIDGNNKDGVEAIPTFLEALNSGVDFVQGSRFIKGGYHANTPFIRLVGMKLFTLPLMRLRGVKFTDPHNGFKGLSRHFLLHPKLQPFRKIFSNYSLIFYLNFSATKLKIRTMEIPVKRIYPKFGPLATKCRGIKMHVTIIFDIFKIILGLFEPKKY